MCLTGSKLNIQTSKKLVGVWWWCRGHRGCVGSFGSVWGTGSAPGRFILRGVGGMNAALGHGCGVGAVGGANAALGHECGFRASDGGGSSSGADVGALFIIRSAMADVFFLLGGMASGRRGCLLPPRGRRVEAGGRALVAQRCRGRHL